MGLLEISKNKISLSVPLPQSVRKIFMKEFKRQLELELQRVRNEEIRSALILPPEILSNIFVFLDIDDKKNVRLVCSTWRDLIDAKPDEIFKIKLDNNSINWVKNIRTSKIELLKIKNLTTAITPDFFNSVNTMCTVIFEEGNSHRNFMQLLSICVEKNVQILKFGHNSLPENEQLLPYLSFPSLKTLEIEIGYKESQKNFHESDLSAPFRLYDFLQKHLSIPSLENIRIFIHIVKTTDFYPIKLLSGTFHFLNGYGNGNIRNLHLAIAHQPGFTSRSLAAEGFVSGISVPPVDCSKLEELGLSMSGILSDFVRSHLIGCNGLKKLWVSNPVIKNSGFKFPIVYPVEPLVDIFISKNSCTLETIHIESAEIQFRRLQLQNFSVLKELSLIFFNCVDIPSLDEFNFPKSLRRLTIEGGRSNHLTVDARRSILAILKLQMEGIQEIHLNPNEYFKIEKLKWILCSFLSLKKLVLLDMDSSSRAENLAHQIKDQIQGICSTSVVIKKNGKVDLHVKL